MKRPMQFEAWRLLRNARHTGDCQELADRCGRVTEREISRLNEGVRSLESPKVEAYPVVWPELIPGPLPRICHDPPRTSAASHISVLRGYGTRKTCRTSPGYAKVTQPVIARL